MSNNTPVVTAAEACELIVDPDVVLFYDGSQVDGISISASGIYADLALADGRNIEVLTATTLHYSRQSWWDSSEDQEQ